MLATVLGLLASCASTSPTRSGTPGGNGTAGAGLGGVALSATQPPLSPSSGATSSPSRPSGTPSGGATGSGTAPTHFATLPPGAALPSDEQCAAWVRARPVKENKGVNTTANHATGQHVDGSLFAGDAAKAASTIVPRIDGTFTGTTQEILRWVACKWGIDENIVFAQAAVESWWRQDTLGDFDSDATACPPGHGLGADGKAGQCPQSYGILQDRWPYMKQGWPGFGRSTAMDADLAYAVWRSCFDGYETWLNTVDRGQQYAAGDAWGCVGRWFAGRWHTSASDGYVTKVKQYESEQIWKTADFQQP
jgi:autotransporter family porin